MKTLMLWPDISEDIPNEIKKRYSEQVDIRNLYRKVNAVERVIRKLLSYLNLSTSMFFDTWISDIYNYDKIILHANVINQSVPEILRRKEFKGRIIYWYWNPACKTISPGKINRDYCELWSFSREDCKEYGMKYNSTYFFEEPVYDCRKPDVDLFFIGADKGRYSRLMEIKTVAEQEGFTTDFRIVKDRTSLPGVFYSDRIDYTQVIELIKKSGIIVELLQVGQTGPSLRVMESLFYGKKLVTDNWLLKEESFYDDRNIFVIEHNDLSGLSDFLKIPNVPVPEKWMEYYDFKTWLDRFDKGETEG